MLFIYQIGFVIGGLSLFIYILGHIGLLTLPYLVFAMLFISSGLIWFFRQKLREFKPTHYLSIWHLPVGDPNSTNSMIGNKVEGKAKYKSLTPNSTEDAKNVKRIKD